ncbi:MAG: hypothetical protein DMG13_33080 [Acidobacteria bacterium]|nr:MAG: hypothetical protein DMG13_33080 [Acidobacteriota bacterium]
MFCPRCRAEYRAGFHRCSDCDIELVEQLPADAPPRVHRRSSESAHAELVILRTYPTVIDAELAKTALDSVGIDSMVRSDNEGGQSPGLSFSRGVELLVRANDADAANDILGVEGIEEP